MLENGFSCYASNVEIPVQIRIDLPFNRISPEIPLALGGGMNGDIILEKD